MTTATTMLNRDARIGAAAMLGIAVVWPRLPVHPPLGCPFRTMTGMPCPLCGMTRAVVAGIHGHFLDSLRFNPAGLLVIAIAIAVLAGARLDRVRIPPWTLLVLAAVLWAWNIGFNPTFH